jgi:SAM-dependent methyltransferase
MTHPPAEFDAYARGYDAGMHDPVKRLVGDTAETFLEHKAIWLLHALRPTGRLLDFGCGNGQFLHALQRLGASLTLSGCDVSTAMLDAAHTGCRGTPTVILRPALPGAVPFGDGEFDVVTALAVFHHIAPRERSATTAELLRVLRPGGRVVLFEHNPLNPVTRWMVRRAPIDANATLLSARESLALLAAAGAVACRLDYILFFPPRLRWCWPVERLLARVPLGGQYVAVGQKVA